MKEATKNFDIYKEVDDWLDKSGEIYNWFHREVIENEQIVDMNSPNKQAFVTVAEEFKRIIFAYRNKFVETANIVACIK